ncbi:MAG TPA: toll/interleukin-1 receptor domain-containing protein [Planctomycetaceae bacterium]|nr:toll/interleukin-1 receptor domain-containing protein [Planctomycetaceae bacterium]
MVADWEISHWPIPAFHAFLSHCAEDREALVMPVYQLLVKDGCIPWIDMHDYPVGKDPFDALRDSLLRSRHVIYFITRNYLRQGRGWCATERAYAEVIQQHFRLRSAVLWDYELPLVFVSRDEEPLLRSTMNPIMSKAITCPFGARHRMKQVAWCAEQIRRLIQQQYALTDSLIERLEADRELRSELDRSHGLRQRLVSNAPIAS